ncbi:MAG: flagellar biosynthesis anti-sigma factor FlgM [Phycisphaerales bacterium]|nr:flagellar biosynthesis anti-sigma factor FlgM [Phycisphaerales bacterium]
MSEFSNTIHPTTVPMTIADCSNVRRLDTDGSDHSAEHARHLAHLRSLPEVRAQRIATIKKMIGDGTFDTDARLSVALDRMFDELRQH